MKLFNRNVPPALVLFFLAPALGELLPGATPPLKFINPFTLILLASLYGSGAILVRELAFRWKKGWTSILIMGAAYAIVEEGMLVKSFFDPGWQDVGKLGVYGRTLGVNWIWTINLIIYHMIASIALPVMLTMFLFPEKKDEPWVGRKMFIFFSGLLLAVTLFGFFFLTKYRPPALQYALFVLLAAGLVFLAKKVPYVPGQAAPGEKFPHGILYGALGMLMTFTLYVTPEAMMAKQVRWETCALLIIALYAGFGFVLYKMCKGKVPPASKLISYIIGFYGLYILFSPVSELKRVFGKDETGLILVDALFLAFFIYLLVKYRKTQQ